MPVTIELSKDDLERLRPFSNLKELPEDDDTKSEEVLDRIEEIRKPLTPLLQKVRKEIQNYDYEYALEELEQVFGIEKVFEFMDDPTTRKQQAINNPSIKSR